MISRFKAIRTLKCPVCRHGDLFPNHNWFDYSFTMNKRCSHCEQKFEPEPGFYYGAMFMSYIMSGFFSLGIVLGLSYLLNIRWEWALVVDILLLGLGFVYLFRLSRSVWIHIVIPYDPKKDNSEQDVS